MKRDTPEFLIYSPVVLTIPTSSPLPLLTNYNVVASSVLLVPSIVGVNVFRCIEPWVLWNEILRPGH